MLTANEASSQVSSERNLVSILSNTKGEASVSRSIKLRVQKKTEKRKIDFQERVVNDKGKNLPLKDNDMRRKKYGIEPRKSPGYRDKAFLDFKDTWREMKSKYQDNIQPGEDEILDFLDQNIASDALSRADLLYVFEKFRRLRALLVRIVHSDALRVFRMYASTNIDIAIDIMKIIETDMQFMNHIIKDDYKIRGLSRDERDQILQELEVENDAESEKWIAYLLFLCNPATEWVRLKMRFQQRYLRMINTAMVQLLVNNRIHDVKKLIAHKLHPSLKDNSEYKLSAIQRADRHYSSFKRNSCPKTCVGHRGKLLLLCIRQGHVQMVQLMLQQGVNASTQCCSGGTKALYWGKGGDQADSDDEDEDESEDEDDAVTLKSEYEYVTPLSRAAESSSMDIVKLLVDKHGANPLQCADIAIRSCVKTVLDKEVLNGLNAGENDMLVNQMQEDEYIFNLVVDIGQRNLAAKAKSAGHVPPNYCTVALIYQSVLENLWGVEAVLTTSFSQENQYNSVLSSFGLQDKGKTGKEDMKEIERVPRKSGKTLGRKKSMRPRKSTMKKKKSMKGGEDFEINRKDSKRSRGKSIIGRTKRLSSVAIKRKSQANDMDLNKCFIIVRVIDKLLEDIFVPNAVTHGRQLEGIVTLLEKHKLHLNKARYDLILKAIETSLKTVKPGDVKAVYKVFKNPQFLHYLGWVPDKSWSHREISKFVKDPKAIKWLKLKSKTRNKHLTDADTKQVMLENILVLACQVDAPDLIRDFRKHDFVPREITRVVMMKEAAEEENLNSITAISNYYGKYLLNVGFETGSENGCMDSVQRVLELAADLDGDEHDNLIDDWVTDILTDVDGDVYTMKLTIDFYFIGTVLSPVAIDKVIKQCFTNQRPMNFKGLSYFLGKATTIYPDLITAEVITEYLRGKQSQFEGKTSKEQEIWLTLLKYLLDHIRDTDEKRRAQSEIFDIVGQERFTRAWRRSGRVMSEDSYSGAVGYDESPMIE